MSNNLVNGVTRVLIDSDTVVPTSKAVKFEIDILKNKVDHLSAGQNLDIVTTPSFITPDDNMFGVDKSFTIVGSTFKALYNLTHKNTVVQVAKDNGFVEVVHNKAYAGSTTVELDDDFLEEDTQYWYRFKYVALDGSESAWSNIQTCTTKESFVYIEKPTITSPSNTQSNLDDAFTITTGDFIVHGGTDTHTSTQYVISKNIEFTDVVVDSGEDSTNLNSFTLPRGMLTVGTNYYLRVRFKGTTLGNSIWSNIIVVTTATVFSNIITPTNQVPSNNATNIQYLGFNLSGTAFDVFGDDTHIASQWQVSTDIEFGNIVVNSGEDTTNLTSYHVGEAVLSANTEHYWKVRYKGQTLGWSNWSTPTIFTTEPIRIVIPAVVTPTYNTQDLDPNNISITTSEFTTTGGDDVHQYTQMQVAKDESFTNIVHDSGGLTTTTSYKVPNDLLLPSTTYYIRVRYCGVFVGWTDWSNSTLVTTEKWAVGKPSVILPVSGSSDIGPSTTIETSSFTLEGHITDDHTGTEYTISKDSVHINVVLNKIDDANLTSLVIDEGVLEQNTTYYVKVRHQGSTFGWSNWSDNITFSTIAVFPYINIPVGLSPINSETDIVPVDTQLTASAFTNVGVEVDTHINSQWQVSTDIDFSNVVYDSGVDGVNLTTITLPTNQLNHSTQYYYRVKYEGQTLGWTEYSTPITFTTEVWKIVKPSNVSPSDGEVGVLNVCDFEYSSFTVQGTTTDTPQGIQLQIATDIGFTNTVHDVTVGYSDTYEIPADVMLGETIYYWKVRHQGSTYGWSEWSTPTSFTTKALGIDKPVLITPTEGYSDNFYENGIHVTLEPFSSNGTDTPNLYELEVATDSGFTDIIVNITGSYSEDFTQADIPPLTNINVEHYFRIRVSGNNFPYSEWSDVRTIVPLDYEPVILPIIAPTDNESILDYLSITIDLDDTYLDDSSCEIYPTAAFYQIAHDSEFTDIVYESPTGESYATSIYIGNKLRDDRTYYFRVQNRFSSGPTGNDLGWSDFDMVTFHTIDMYVEPPVLQIDSTDITYPTLITNDFTPLPDSVDNLLVHYSIQFQAATENTFTNIAYDNTYSETGFRKTLPLPEITLTKDTYYYFRVRWNGKQRTAVDNTIIEEFTDWSNVVEYDYKDLSIEPISLVGFTNGETVTDISNYVLTFTDNTNANIQPVNIEYVLADNAEYTTPVVSETISFANPLTIGSNLIYSTQYYLKARIEYETTSDNTSVGWSDWLEVNFITEADSTPVTLDNKAYCLKERYGDTLFYDCVVDSNNNLYITGHDDVYGSALLIKLDSSFNVLKSYWFNDGLSGGNQMRSIVIDSSDNLYCCGIIGSAGFTSGTNDTWLMKLDTEFNIISQKHMGGVDVDWFTGMTINVNTNVLYCAGYSNSETYGSSDCFVASFDTDLNVIDQYKVGDNYLEKFEKVCLDSLGNVYCVGYTQSPSASYGNFDGLVVKLNSNLTIAKQIHIGSSNAGDYLYDITIDSNDNIYCVGYSGNGTYTAECGWVVKLDSDLNVLVQKEVGGEYKCPLSSICIDVNDNVFIGGKFEESYGSGLFSGVLIKMDTSLVIQDQINIKGSSRHEVISMNTFGTSIYVGTQTNQYDADLDGILYRIQTSSFPSGVVPNITEVSFNPITYSSVDFTMGSEPSSLLNVSTTWTTTDVTIGTFDTDVDRIDVTSEL